MSTSHLNVRAALSFLHSLATILQSPSHVSGKRHLPAPSHPPLPSSSPSLFLTVSLPHFSQSKTFVASKSVIKPANQKVCHRQFTCTPSLLGILHTCLIFCFSLSWILHVLLNTIRALALGAHVKGPALIPRVHLLTFSRIPRVGEPAPRLLLLRQSRSERRRNMSTSISELLLSVFSTPSMSRNTITLDLSSARPPCWCCQAL